MQDFIKWINMPVEKIIADPIYRLYFSNSELRQDDKTFYVSNLKMGIELVLSFHKIIQSIHFFGATENQFHGALPFNVSFNLSRSKIGSMFGKPNRNGGGDINIFIGYIKKWDKYILPECSIRFEYTDNEERIVLVTVASLALEAYFDSKLQ